MKIDMPTIVNNPERAVFRQVHCVKKEWGPASGGDTGSDF